MSNAKIAPQLEMPHTELAVVMIVGMEIHQEAASNDTCNSSYLII